MIQYDLKVPFAFTISNLFNFMHELAVSSDVF